MTRGPSIELRPSEGRSVKLARPVSDRRTAAEFRAALERETTASLRTDPGRWPWTRSDLIPDRHRSRRPEGRRW